MSFMDKFRSRNEERSELEGILYRLGLSADIPIQMALETLGLAGNELECGTLDEETYSEWYGQVLKTLPLRIFDKYFLPEIHAAENIPDGGALLVSNHSGMFGWDGFAVATQVYRRTGRAVMPLGFDRFTRSDVCKSLGLIGRDRKKAVEMLRDNRLLYACPGGAEEVAKPSTEAYQVQEVGGFAHGKWGYLKLALAAQRPIIPIGVVGAEETHYNYGNIKHELGLKAGIAYALMPGRLKKLMGPLMKALELTQGVPKLRNVLPERSKIYVWVGEPIDVMGELPGFDLYVYETLRTEKKYHDFKLPDKLETLYQAHEQALDDMNQSVLSRIERQIHLGLEYRTGIMQLEDLAKGKAL